jgi:dolichyl-phosphate mannosyltransferase polypeptide 2 regulatory subunit
MRDRTFGALALAALTALYAYYTIWALVTPLIDVGHPVLRLFPRFELAVAIPAYLGACVVGASACVVGVAMIAHDPKRA